MYDKLIKAARMWLRISTDAFDDEILQLIQACIIDLQNGGVVRPMPDDSIVQQAIKLYCKAMFGQNSESEKYEKAYEHLKAALALSGEYNKEY